MVARWCSRGGGRSCSHPRRTGSDGRFTRDRSRVSACLSPDRAAVPSDERFVVGGGGFLLGERPLVWNSSSSSFSPRSGSMETSARAGTRMRSPTTWIRNALRSQGRRRGVVASRPLHRWRTSTRCLVLLGHAAGPAGAALCVKSERMRFVPTIGALTKGSDGRGARGYVFCVDRRMP